MSQTSRSSRQGEGELSAAAWARGAGYQGATVGVGEGAGDGQADAAATVRGRVSWRGVAFEAFEDALDMPGSNPAAGVGDAQDEEIGLVAQADSDPVTAVAGCQ